MDIRRHPGDPGRDGPTARRAARRARRRAVAEADGDGPGDDELVTQALSGDPDAYGRLYLRWFGPVFEVARRMVHDPDSAAEVAQEVFLNGWRNLAQLRDGAAFGGWLLCSARNRALNLVERERRSMTVDLASPSDGPGPATGVPWERLAVATDPTDALADADVAALVWESAEALGPRDQSLLDLHLRHGLSAAEIAEQMEVEPNAAHQMLHRLRKRLKAAVQARVLWRDGTPACSDLAALVTGAGATAFDAATVQLVDGHAEGCTECGQRRRTKLAPATLFGSATASAAPISLVTRVADALAADGVPMGRVPRDLRRRRGRGVRHHRVVAAAVVAGTVVAVVVLGWGAVGEPDGAELEAGSGRAGADVAHPAGDAGPSAAGSTPSATSGATGAVDGDPEAGSAGDADAGSGPATTTTVAPAGAAGATGTPPAATPVVGGPGGSGTSGDSSGGNAGGAGSGGAAAGGGPAATTTTTGAPTTSDPPYVKYVQVSPKSCGKGGTVSVTVAYSAAAGAAGWSGSWWTSDGSGGGAVGLADGSGAFTLAADAGGLKVYVEVTLTDPLGRSASATGVAYC